MQEYEREGEFIQPKGTRRKETIYVWGFTVVVVLLAIGVVWLLSDFFFFGVLTGLLA